MELTKLNLICDNGETLNFIIEDMGEDSFLQYNLYDNEGNLLIMDSDLDNIYLYLKDYTQC